MAKGCGTEAETAGTRCPDGERTRTATRVRGGSGGGGRRALEPRSGRERKRGKNEYLAGYAGEFLFLPCSGMDWSQMNLGKLGSAGAARWEGRGQKARSATVGFRWAVRETAVGPRPVRVCICCGPARDG